MKILSLFSDWCIWRVDGPNVIPAKVVIEAFVLRPEVATDSPRFPPWKASPRDDAPEARAQIERPNQAEEGSDGPIVAPPNCGLSAEGKRC